MAHLTYVGPLAGMKELKPDIGKLINARFSLLVLLAFAMVVGFAGCKSPTTSMSRHIYVPPAPVVWPWWPAADEPPSTNRVVLLPPLLQLPEQKAAREEVEKSGVADALVKKMLKGEILVLAELQELARKNVSSETTTKYLRSTGAMYTLTTREIDELRAASVSNEVVDYLLSTKAYRGTVYYYPTYLPVYPYRSYYPWLDSHHHHEIHHDWHHDAHRHH